MADGLNRATLLGNLGFDPELKFTQSGQAVLRMRIATASSWIDNRGERHERTDWHTCIVWGKRAEGLNKILSKGSRVYLEGSIQTRSWDDKKTGEKRYATEIVVSNAVLCGGNGGGSGGSRGGTGSRPSSSGGGRQPGPQGGGFEGHEYQTDDTAGGSYGGGSDDDIPF